MSKITREEAIKIKEIIDDNTEFGYTDWKVVCASIDNIITQQQPPQLSEDVEEGLLKDDLYELSNYDKVRTSRIIKHIKALENKLQEQASEIDRLKQELHRAKIDYGYDITEKGIANKELKEQLNAIREVFNETWAYTCKCMNVTNPSDETIKIYKLNKIKKILEEE